MDLPIQDTAPKDPSGNHMVSAHIRVGSIGYLPVYVPFVDSATENLERSYIILYYLLPLKLIFKDGQIPPNTVTHP